MSDFLPSLPELVPVAPRSTPSSFHRMTVEEHISLLPCYVGQLSNGILEHLNKKVLRYSDDFRGVFLSYSRPTVLQHCGRILDEQPHIHLQVKYEAYIFKPTIGELMCGTINKIGDGHIGCLVHHCFNASVVGRRSGRRDRKSLNGWFDTEQFELGAEIWFRVSGIDSVSGILVIQGEYFELNELHISEDDDLVLASSTGALEIRTRREDDDSVLASTSSTGSQEIRTQHNIMTLSESLEEGKSAKKKKKKRHKTDKDEAISLDHHSDVASSETASVTLVDNERRKEKKRKRKTIDREEEMGVVSKRKKKSKHSNH